MKITAKEINLNDTSQLFVYRALEVNGPLTVMEIAEWTKFHRSTVYRQLSALEDAGLVESERTSDLREKQYRITDGDD